VEAKYASALFQFQNFESRFCKPHTKPIGRNGDKRVADMDDPHK
jgi:hypothetical protein